MTSTGENFLLDLLCRATVAPQVYYVALITSEPPTHFLGGDELDEPTVAQYARAAYANDPGTWSDRTGEMSNTEDIEFPVVVDEVWPTINHWGLLDAEASGTLLFAGSFDAPIDLAIGDQLVIPAGFLTLRTTNYVSRISL